MFDGDENAIVDFKYSRSNRLTWWFDHHQSAFLTPEDEAHFQRDESGRKFLDATRKSCTEFIADVARTRFEFQANGLEPLIHWAHVIDGALYESAAQCVELRAPALQLMQVIESDPDDTFIDEIIKDLTTRSLDEVAMSEEVQRRTVLVHSFSKSYAMTGWRLGWTSSTKELATAMAKLQSQSTSNPTSFAQAGAIAALENPVDAAMMGEFQQRGKIMRELLKDVPGVSCARPEGAFYLFPKVSGLFGVMVDRETQINSATDLASYLLRAAKVALVPGEGFGAPEHVRFSYAASLATIKEGINRILYALPE
jgi:hypothetical protein